MKSIIQPVQGTRDFYPEEMGIRTWLYNTMRSVAESFGYQEWEAPLLENLNLYAAKSGDELVKKQSYVLTDRDGQSITLRPELTPSLARMIAQRQQQLTFPLRWWSFGPFWRHEHTQRGRKREFFQWNVDMVGPESPEADAENVAVLATFFRRVGLTPQDVQVLVSNRRLLNERLESFGVDASLRPEASAWIDRRAKMSAMAWEKDGADIGLSLAQIGDVKAMLEDMDLWIQSPQLTRFFAAAEALGISDYVRFDPSIVRGLLYYTGTVFEAWEVGGEIKRSILGGGRYDNLLADVGGNQLGAVGFAMGDVVITDLLETRDLLPKQLKIQPASVVVTVFDQERLLISFRVATMLRSAGIAAALYPEPAKLPKQFKYADKMAARVALVIGPDEAANAQVTVKDLSSGTQETVAETELIGKVRRILESPRSG